VCEGKSVVVESGNRAGMGHKMRRSRTDRTAAAKWGWRLRLPSAESRVGSLAWLGPALADLDCCESHGAVILLHSSARRRLLSPGWMIEQTGWSAEFSLAYSSVGRDAE
jgi:hypothetical protein